MALCPRCSSNLVKVTDKFGGVWGCPCCGYNDMDMYKQHSKKSYTLNQLATMDERKFRFLKDIIQYQLFEDSLNVKNQKSGTASSLENDPYKEEIMEWAIRNYYRMDGKFINPNKRTVKRVFNEFHSINIKESFLDWCITMISCTNRYRELQIIKKAERLRSENIIPPTIHNTFTEYGFDCDYDVDDIIRTKGFEDIDEIHYWEYKSDEYDDTIPYFAFSPNMVYHENKINMPEFKEFVMGLSHNFEDSNIVEEEIKSYLNKNNRLTINEKSSIYNLGMMLYCSNCYEKKVKDTIGRKYSL